MSELECTIRTVSNAIFQVISTRELGTQLELLPNQLNEIEEHPKHEQRLRLVETWFEQDPHPSWEKLVAALTAPLVGENIIAIQIEERYVTISRSPPSSPQLEEETKDNKGTSVTMIKICILHLFCLSSD